MKRSNVYMKRFSHELLKKEFGKNKNNLIIGLVFLVLTIICTALIFVDDKREPKNTISLHDAIETADNYNLKSHVEIKGISDKITTINGNSDKILAMIYDDDYMYLVVLNKEKFDELYNKENLNENPVKVYGTTKSNATVKNTTIRWFNSYSDEDSQKLTSKDFDSYLGNIYLDTTEISTNSTILAVVIMLSGICSFSFLLVYFIYAARINSCFKKIDDDELAKIESELDGKETFHYERAHLILTKNYIISGGGTILITKIKDIFWIYEHRLRQNGITTQKSLFVLTTDGKTKSIMNVDGVTKKSTAALQEIMDTIVSRNDKILVGYSKENQEKAREFTKELKRQKKEAKNSQ